MRTPKVLLVSMPFGALERQALGISILKAILVERGIVCDIRYLNFSLAELIGTDDYIWLSNDVPHTAFAGEWIFSRALYGKNAVAEANYISEVLQDESKVRIRRFKLSSVAPTGRGRWEGNFIDSSPSWTLYVTARRMLLGK